MCGSRRRCFGQCWVSEASNPSPPNPRLTQNLNPQLLASLKTRVANGKPAVAKHVKTGVLTNADKLCNCMPDVRGWGG